MTKKDFFKAVASRTNMTAEQIALVLSTTAIVAAEKLALADEVRVPGLVTLRAKLYKSRPARNPRSGAPVMIPAARRLSGKPVNSLIAAVQSRREV